MPPAYRSPYCDTDDGGLARILSRSPQRMYASLQQLESLRGKASRTFISSSESSPVPEVGARWTCGCVATGPSFRQLVVRPERCCVHLSQQSLVTQRIVLPDPGTLKNPPA